jgi:hypothetical protein
MPLIPHNTELYLVGKGILYIAEWSGTTPPTDPTDYEDVGNCTSFECEPMQERLEHYSSRSGYRTRDKYPIIETKYSLTFDLDEFAAKNMNRFLAGTLSANEVLALQGANLEYALKFISDNPTGPNFVARMWKVVLSSNGAMQWIGDDWAIMSFTGEGLADTANHASSPYITVTYVTTTTTTTTSSTTSTTSSTTSTTSSSTTTAP